jgi:hypothetical protein
VSRPLTYGDISPKLCAYLISKALQRAQYRKIDPMQITLTIYEIANGVLIVTGDSGDHDHLYYPDPATAFAAAPELLQQAWADACDRRPSASNPLGLSRAERERYECEEGRGGIMPEVEEAQQTRSQPGDKLPEEAAAENAGVESVPSVFEDAPLAQTIEGDETEQAVRQYEDTFVRSEPVMRVAEPDYGDEQRAAD